MQALSQGEGDSLPWGKLDEYAYQLLLNREVRLRSSAEALTAVEKLGERRWGRGEDIRQIVRQPSRENGWMRFETTDEGHELLQVAFENYANLFLD